MSLPTIFHRYPDQEACWKYNRRESLGPFAAFMRGRFA